MDKEIPNWMLVGLVIACALLGLMFFDQREKLHVYTKYFRERSPEVSLRLGELSSQMDEPAIRKHFDGVPLTCIAENGGLGDRVCYSPIDKADTLPAMTLAIFFSQGRLATVIVQMPWWTHGAWRDSLDSRNGPPQNAGTVAGQRGDVVRWRLNNGNLEMNRNRGINPLAWSAVMWTGRENN